MNEKRLIEIIHRPGMTGGREQAARTAEVSGGELAKLAGPIRWGEWPATEVKVPPFKGSITLPLIERTFKDPAYGPESAVVLAERAGWHSIARKIRGGGFDPNKRPTNGDGAGIDCNDGRLKDPVPKFLRQSKFDGDAARERAEALSRQKKSRRPQSQPDRWDPHIEKRRAQM